MVKTLIKTAVKPFLFLDFLVVLGKYLSEFYSSKQILMNISKSGFSKEKQPDKLLANHQDLEKSWLHAKLPEPNSSKWFLRGLFCLQSQSIKIVSNISGEHWEMTSNWFLLLNNISHHVLKLRDCFTLHNISAGFLRVYYYCYY